MEWFEKQPGHPLVKEDGQGGAMLIVGSIPDEVRLPRDPATFGQDAGLQVKVLRGFMGLCPKTKTICRHLELDYQLPARPGHNLHVAESTAAEQFFWYVPKTAADVKEVSSPDSHSKDAPDAGPQS